MSDLQKTVIFKKSCAAPSCPDYIYVKQLMIVGEGDKRKLALRLTNERDEAVTAVTLSVWAFDEDGARISAFERRIAVSGGAGKTFVPDVDIELDEAAVECSVTVLSAEYGAYRYKIDNGELAVKYIGDIKADGVEQKAQAAKKSSVSKAGKSGITVTRRRIKNPVLITLAVIAALLFAVLAIYVQLLIFKSTEKTFIYAGVVYSFENDDSSDGTDIYVEGYHGARARVVIPDEIEGHKVKGIRAKAFKDNAALVSVGFEGEIPVESGAFENCSALKTVEFEKIVSLGTGVFKNCVMLEKAFIPAAFDVLPRETFKGCKNLASVEFEASPVAIGIDKDAFNGCIAIREMNFNRRIDLSKNTAVFSGAEIDSLHLVDLNAKEDTRLSELFGVSQVKTPSDVGLGAVKIDYLKNIPVSFCQNLGITSFEVERLDEPIIPDHAFDGCKNLSEFLYADAVIGVGERAFYRTAIKSFDGATLGAIGAYAFAENAKLETVTLTGNTALDRFGVGAFYNCSSLLRIFIPVNVTVIPVNAFYGCSALNSVRFNDSAQITGIGQNAFYNCKALGRLAGFGDSLAVVGDGAFKGCAALTELQLPDSLSTIGSSAFEGCAALTDFTVPNGVSGIGKGAFKDCIRLMSLSTPFIGETRNASLNNCLAYMFGGYGHNDIKAVPASLEKVAVTDAAVISSYAFYGQDKLTEVELCDVTAVESYAFAYCSALEKLDLPNTLISIGESAFSGCSAFKEFTVPKSVTFMGQGLFGGINGLEKLAVPFVGSGVYASGDGACLAYLFGASGFSESYRVPSSLKSVEITNTSRIPDYAFYGCTNIENIVLPDTLKTIGNYAFRNCLKIKSLTVPESVTSVGYGMLIGMENIEELSVPFIGSSAYGTGMSGKRYSVSYYYSVGAGDNDGTYAFGKKLKSVTVTNSTAIYENAFNGCNRVERISFYSDISSFPDNLFEPCYKLYEIYNIGEGSASLVAGEGAAENVLAVHVSADEAPLPTLDADGFRYVNGFAEVESDAWYMLDYPVEQDEFGNDKPVTEITLPEKVESEAYSFEKYALWRFLFGQTQIAEIVLPKSVRAIGEYAFYQCNNLDRADMSATTVNKVPYNAFAFCYRLSEADFPQTLEQIDEYAFYACNRLKKIRLPEKLESIGAQAFYACNRLFEVYNLSELDIAKGEWTNGCVALNARAVYGKDVLADKPNIELPQTYVDGVQYIKLGDNGTDWWAVDFTGDRETLEIKPFDYNGEHVTRVDIFGGAFDNVNYGVTKIIIGNVIETIGYAFNVLYNTASIEIVDNGGAFDKIEIGDQAFYNLCNLTALKVSVPVSRIGNRAFDIRYVDSVEFTKRVDSIDGGAFFASEIYDDAVKIDTEIVFADIGKVCSGAFNSTCKNIVKLSALDVECIDGNAFNGISRLSSVKLGNVGEIRDNAFYNCTALETVELGSAETVGRFGGCGKLKTVHIGNGNKPLVIGSDAFRNTALAEFVYDGNISSIGDGAFREVYSLKTVAFGGNVDTVGGYAFYNSGIESVTFKGNVGTIGTYAFAYSLLPELEFGGELGALSYCSFAYSNRLKTIALPDSLSVIAENAFLGCNALREVVLPAALTELRYAFNNCNNILAVYNRSSLLESYIRQYITEPIIVTNDKNAAAVDYVVDDGGYTFAFVAKAWYLIALPNVGGSWYYALPEKFTSSGGEVTKYKIAKYALSGSAFIIGDKAVTAIDSRAFSFNYAYVYFTGAKGDFGKLYTGNSNPHVYGYKACIHGDEVNDHWRYDDTDNTPVISETYIDDSFWTVKQAPTCLKLGKQTATCPTCKKEIQRSIYYADHDIVDGKCSMCGQAANVVTSFTAPPDGVKFTNDSRYAYTVTGKGVIASTNKADNSTSTLSADITKNADIIIKYRVSSESYCDIFRVRVNGIVFLEASGTDNGTLTLQLHVGDKVEISYSKNNSGSVAKDCVTIDEFIVILTEGRQ